MSKKKKACALRPIASTERGRLLECPGHRGYILEFGPLVIRLREKEFMEIADLIDQLVMPGENGCTDCQNADCRGNNFVIEIAQPRMSIEFFREEVPALHELFVEARLSLMLWENQILRP